MKDALKNLWLICYIFSSIFLYTLMLVSLFDIRIINGFPWVLLLFICLVNMAFSNLIVNKILDS